MALRWVLWCNAWPVDAQEWEFTGIDHHALRERGFAPVSAEPPHVLNLPHIRLIDESFYLWWSEIEKRGCWISTSYDAFGGPRGVTASYAGFCEGCGVSLESLRDCAYELFEHGRVTCRDCGTPNDIWRAALENAAERGGQVLSLRGLGASNTSFYIEMTPGETKTIDLTQYQIVFGAVVLDLQVTTIGEGVQALLVHGNDALRRTIDGPFALYGRPLGVARPDPINVQLHVLWVFEGDDSEPWRLIADAFEAFRHRKFGRSVAAMHTAFEVSLNRLIRDYVAATVDVKTAREFGSRDLSAYGAANVYLPLLCSAAGIPRPTKELTDKINLLRTRRNKVAHDALADDAIGTQAAAELVVAGIFGFEFVRFARMRLQMTGILSAARPPAA